nr:hypothetical protein Itr_chr14CG11950 [Ipomoea trifida]
MPIFSPLLPFASSSLNSDGVEEGRRQSGTQGGTLMESLAVYEYLIWQGRWKKRQERLATERRETMKRVIKSREGMMEEWDPHDDVGEEEETM